MIEKYERRGERETSSHPGPITVVTCQAVSLWIFRDIYARGNEERREANSPARGMSSQITSRRRDRSIITFRQDDDDEKEAARGKK